MPKERPKSAYGWRPSINDSLSATTTSCGFVGIDLRYSRIVNVGNG